MKKVLSFVLCLMLVIACVSVYAEEPTAVYSFGDVVNSVEIGDEIEIPLYLTVDEKPINSVNFKVSFNENAFEFLDLKKKNLGDHDLTFIVSGLDMHDSSIASVFLLSYETTNVFSETLLCNLRFKVKDEAIAGDSTFEICYSSVVCNDTNADKFTSEKYSANSVDVFVNGIEEGSQTEEENNGDEEETDIDEDIDIDESDLLDDEITEEKPEDDIEDKTEEKPEIVQPAAPEFSDLAGYEWAKDYIIPLAQQGIIKGTGETTFSPANNITRADFMVLLMRLLEIDGKTSEGFTDVPADAYFANAVANAKKMGIAKGGSDGNFNPYNSITREDLCVLVYRALNSRGFLPVVPDDGTFKAKYTDIDIISDYAFDAMHELYLNGIIGGSDGKVNPKGFATRAETAVIMFRISKLIPEI